MTKGLDEFFNLPNIEDDLAEEGVIDPFEQMEGLPADKASAEDHVAFLEGKDHADSTEVIFKETLKHSRDMMDMAFNVEPRFSRGIFEVATTMYKVALDAKNSKRDAQLKAMKLALDRRKLELDERKNGGETATDIEGSSSAVLKIDRNDLMEQIRQKLAQDPTKGS